MKVHVDQGLCNGYGHCVIEAPAYFDLSEDSGKAVLLRQEVSDDGRAAIGSAVTLCPVQAISASE
jgi:ferredoxin